jgi:hypothetical protein
MDQQYQVLLTQVVVVVELLALTQTSPVAEDLALLYFATQILIQPQHQQLDLQRLQ